MAVLGNVIYLKLLKFFDTAVITVACLSLIYLIFNLRKQSRIVHYKSELRINSKISQLNDDDKDFILEEYKKRMQTLWKKDGVIEKKRDKNILAFYLKPLVKLKFFINRTKPSILFEIESAHINLIWNDTFENREIIKETKDFLNNIKNKRRIHYFTESEIKKLTAPEHQDIEMGIIRTN